METVPAKHLIHAQKSTAWFGTDYTMNIYRGCSHGCIYCDSRSECYQIEDFDTVKAKADALRILRDDLQRKVKSGVVATGAMSDPYNPREREHQLTRHALELLHAYSFGVAIATKSPLVTRDIDVLSDIKRYSPVLVKMTITTADDDLCRKIEPHAAPASQRFEALKALSEAGIFCGVLLMPLLPFINDTPENICEIARRTAEVGAKFIYPSLGVTLRTNQRTYFYEQLDRSFPGTSEKYRTTFAGQYNCSSPRAKTLWPVLKYNCDRFGLLTSMRHIIGAYKRGYGDQQLRFFDL